MHFHREGGKDMQGAYINEPAHLHRFRVSILTAPRHQQGDVMGVQDVHGRDLGVFVVQM